MDTIEAMEILKYLETFWDKEFNWDEVLPPGIDLGDKYPSAPCPNCPASWFEGCNREGFCEERIEPMKAWDALPKEIRDNILKEDWKRYVKWRKKQDKPKTKTDQMTLF